MNRFATCSLIAALSVAAGSSSALTVNLSGLDVNAQFNANGGSFGGVSAPLGAASATHSFTVTGLDVADDGSANDTVVFSYDVDATGGVLSLMGNPFSYGIDGASDPADNEIDPGEALTFSNLAADVTLGDSNAGTLTLVSAAFVFFQSRFPGGGDDVQLTGSDGVTPVVPAVAPNGGGNDPYDFSADPQTAFTVTAGDGGNGFGIDSISADFEFNFEPVPEPGSLALLGLGGLLIARRRRG
ncbi:MAG: PEP-CTERM sorting domain-containing protein [Phycisphaeraceae bacterium]|nr:PEP-CTERM sorting domain-containing protein [Phycisphaeraceae bacterium]